MKVYLAMRTSPETVGGGCECKVFRTLDAAKAWGVGWAEDLAVYETEPSDEVDDVEEIAVYRTSKWA